MLKKYFFDQKVPMGYMGYWPLYLGLTGPWAQAQSRALGSHLRKKKFEKKKNFKKN
jgi:cadmium resistance protein CadD (predicted permease)